MPDLARFLLGSWRLTRLGWDGLRAQSFRLDGIAVAVACDAGLSFEERGTLRLGDHAGEAVRRYLFHIAGSGAAAEVCFADGRPFHTVDLATGSAAVVHDCAPDRYQGRYRVLDADRWCLGWRVTGQRKNYVSVSRFVRIVTTRDGTGTAAVLPRDEIALSP